MPIDDDSAIRELLERSKTIAVIGASDKPWRDSQRIASYLMKQGYDIYPVNPRYEAVLGVKCFPDLRAVPTPVDIVDVFRRPEAVPDIVESALAVHAKALWLQLGVIHEEAARRAEQGGMIVVMDRCILVDHQRLIQ